MLILISLLSPSLKKMLLQAELLECKSNLRTSFNGSMIYHDDHASFPKAYNYKYTWQNSTQAIGPSIWQSLLEYVQDNQNRVCPKTQRDEFYYGNTTSATENYSYIFNDVLTGVQSVNQQGGLIEKEDFKLYPRPWAQHQVVSPDKVLWITERSSVIRMDQYIPYGRMRVAFNTGYEGFVDTSIVHDSIKHDGTFNSPWGSLPVYSGLNNVAFVDGSVRSTSIFYNKMPCPPWLDDVHIDPTGTY